MSNTDATKNKLLDSMRLSKGGVTETASGSAAPSSPEAKPATKKAATKKKARKAAPKKAAAKKPVRKAAPKAASSGTYSSEHSAEIAADKYQSRGRVWPD